MCDIGQVYYDISDEKFEAEAIIFAKNYSRNLTNNIVWKTGCHTKTKVLDLHSMYLKRIQFKTLVITNRAININQ